MGWSDDSCWIGLFAPMIFSSSEYVIFVFLTYSCTCHISIKNMCIMRAGMDNNNNMRATVHITRLYVLMLKNFEKLTQHGVILLLLLLAWPTTLRPHAPPHPHPWLLLLLDQLRPSIQGGILVGLSSKSVGSIPTVTIPNPDHFPNSELFQMQIFGPNCPQPVVHKWNCTHCMLNLHTLCVKTIHPLKNITHCIT